MSFPLCSQHLSFDDLESHIEDLVYQKYLLQDIGRITNNKVDFGDIIEAYSLIVLEIERLQQELKLSKLDVSKVPREEEVFEEEEEEVEPSSSKYLLEHVVTDEEGITRRVTDEDLCLDKNDYVRNAFKVFYEWQKAYKPTKMEGLRRLDNGPGRYNKISKG
ncbi:MAG: hypothetical protein C4575_07310 [Desulforudis sp.]|jgi:hypothetical protein|nr:MAG: hypothetical protein C4575_07310 [Desulforudis sp.]